MEFIKNRIPQRVPWNILGVILLLVAVPATIFLVQKAQDFRSRAFNENGPDIDVLFIKRTPEYDRYRVEYPNGYPKEMSGSENTKHWPDAGETVTFAAVVKNNGKVTSDPYQFRWLVDGQQIGAVGNAAPLTVGQKVENKVQWQWQNGEHTVEFEVIPMNSSAEVTDTNNKRSINTMAHTLKIFVENSVYQKFNQNKNLKGSFSFEDWIQAHIDEINRKIAEAGGKTRVRVGDIEYVADKTLPRHSTHAPGGLNDYDGYWGFETDEWCYPGECQGNDIRNWIARIQPSLAHEWAHQLGMAHSGDMNISAENNPLNNIWLVIKDPDVVGIGGDDIGRAFEEGTKLTPYFIKALDSTWGKRRGFYAEYLFDIPRNNTVRVLGSSGQPLQNASIKVFQSNERNLSGQPIASGTLDSNGQFTLPNRPLINAQGGSMSSVSTPTGHTLYPNPFGLVNVTGSNGLLMFEITSGTDKEYKFLTAHEFNKAFWNGSTQNATHTITVPLAPNGNGTNLALNKNATASRQPEMAGGAVDGNKSNPDGNFWRPHNTSRGTWWQVDLGQQYPVYKVKIWGWAGNPADMFPAYHIELSPTGQFNGEQTTVATVESWNNTRTDQFSTHGFAPRSARYVRIVSDTDSGFPVIQEVEVFANDGSSGDVKPSVTPSPTVTPTVVQCTQVRFQSGTPVCVGGRTTISYFDYRCTDGFSGRLTDSVCKDQNTWQQQADAVCKTRTKCVAPPTSTPTRVPTATPTRVPSPTPTRVPTATPTRVPTSTPTRVPTNTPTPTKVVVCTQAYLTSSTPTNSCYISLGRGGVLQGYYSMTYRCSDGFTGTVSSSSCSYPSDLQNQAVARCASRQVCQ